ncbi:MAG TPA: YtxH domain-containing protein [Pricia sp.]|nr:YtxH domain-containing protein [Pricia sp.]
MKNSSKNTEITLALLAGVAIGGIVSILYAPDSGKRTRQKIRESSNRATDAFVRAATELKGKAEHAYLNEKASLQAKLDSIASDVRHNKEEMLPLLEKKLKEMKAKSQKVKKGIKA